MSLVLSALILFAGPVRAQIASTVPVRSLYSLGHELRRAGKIAEAKDAFMRLLAEEPGSGGALEGLSLTCLSRGEYEEALGYAWRWEKSNSSNPYVVNLERRALEGLHRHEEALDVERRVAELSPCDVRARRSVDSDMRERRPGLFPRGRVYKSLGPEGLETGRPQRIVYEGRSGEVRGRARLRQGLFATAGVEVSQEAQRNDTGGFSYYDILERVYWAGLESRPDDDLFFYGEYGQSILSDNKGSGVGRLDFSRARLGAEWHHPLVQTRVRAERAPRFLRGFGTNTYFVILRETSVRADAAAEALGLQWLARAGLSDLSEGTTLKTWGLSATKEFGNELLVPNYSHGQSEFYGATPAGRLGYVMTDRLGLRWRHLVDDAYRLSSSYGYTWHRDGNRLHDFSGEATGWLPWLRDLCGSRPLSATYRFDSLDYTGPADGYRSTDRETHTLGAYWRQGWRRGTWTTVGYEHSFVRDFFRGHYEGRAVVGELEAYRAGSLSVSAEGRVGNSTVRDESYSAGLRGRWSF